MKKCIDSKEGDRKMKLMSFNTQHCLNYLTRKIDFDVMADAILSTKADVVGLNEMRGAGAHPEYTAQVEALAEKTGMPYFYFARAIDVPGGGPYGNGILSRVPILSAETVLIPDPLPRAGAQYETRCILRATLAGGVTVLVTHFGLYPEEQENAVKAVLSQLIGEKCILMGDFNVTPNNPILAPIRERMRDTADLFEGARLSFPSDAPKHKIDYIFTSPDVTVTEADIPAIIASDHRPHTATVSL